MGLNNSSARLFLGVALIAAAVYLRQGEALAQNEMPSMPDMSPTATPTAPGTTSPSPSPTPPEKPAGPAMPGHDMSSMPGMTPAGSPSGKPAQSDDMSDMPGMKASGDSTNKRVSQMPGMTDMSGMKSSKGAAPGPPRISAPGVTVLGPRQKWNPPAGDERSRELLSPAELKEHMEPLPAPVEDAMIHSYTLAEILEYRVNSSGPDTFRWDIFGWVGTDWNRLWYKTEGNQQLGGTQTGDGDLQLLYGRLIAPFWDFQIGARTEQSLGRGRADVRTYAVIGVQGLAPYLFDVEPSLFISDRGQVSARLTVSFDLLLTQRLVLQPRFEGTAALQSDEKRGMGDGLNETDLGLRLRYEIRREIAPYLGVSWLRQYGETARMSRSEGESSESISFVAGVRLWW